MRYGGYNLPATPGRDGWEHIFGIMDERDLEWDQMSIDQERRNAIRYEGMFTWGGGRGPQSESTLNMMRAHMQSIDDEIQRLFDRMAWRRQRRIRRNYDEPELDLNAD